MNAAALRYLRTFVRNHSAKWAQCPEQVKFLMPPMLCLLDKAQAQQLIIDAVDHVINERGGIDMRRRTQKYLDFCWDQHRVEEYLLRRIKSTGSLNLLRTSKMRVRYPHINNQNWSI